METNELIEVLRERLSIRLEFDREIDYGNEYGIFNISLNYVDDDGNEHCISSDSGIVS